MKKICEKFFVSVDQQQFIPLDLLSAGNAPVWGCGLFGKILKLLILKFQKNYDLYYYRRKRGRT